MNQKFDEYYVTEGINDITMPLFKKCVVLIYYKILTIV